MKISDDFEVLRAIIENATDRIVTTEQLLHEGEVREMPFEFTDLIGYWKKGQLYASLVERTDNGYLPTVNCVWTTQYQRNFFGYNPALGSFEINSNTQNPITAILDASIALQSAAVCVTIHPSGKEFAIGTLNGAIVVCNVDQGRITRTFRANQSRVWALAYSPTENLLIIGHQNGELVKWDRNGNLLARIITDDWVRSIDFSPDGKQLLTSHRFKDHFQASIYSWDINSFTSISPFVHVPDTVWCLRYLHDGKGFASGGSDRKVTIWSFENKEILWSEKKHTGTVITLAVHPFGGIVASGAWTGTVKLWDLETGKDVRSIEAHAARVYGLAISPSGRMLATGGKESSIALWQLPECSIIGRFTGHAGWVRGMQFIDENTLVSIGSEGMCKIWRLSHSLPVAIPIQPYESSQEVLNEFRRPLDSDDEQP
jgi:WD40 repeat protein